MHSSPKRTRDPIGVELSIGQPVPTFGHQVLANATKPRPHRRGAALHPRVRPSGSTILKRRKLALGNVNRNRKADPYVAAVATQADDLRVDSNYLPNRIEERSS